MENDREETRILAEAISTHGLRVDDGIAWAGFWICIGLVSLAIAL